MNTLNSSVTSVSATTVLRCTRAVLPTGIVDDVRLTITDGIITAISGAGVPDPSDGTAAEDVGGTVLPGFVDTHVHGGGGADFATRDPAEARRAVAYHRGQGTTTMFASLVTDTVSRIVRQIRTLVPLCVSGELAGIHLEGPFLAPSRCGAHDPGLLIAPTPEALDALLEAADGNLAMVTMAPELPGAEQAYDRLVSAGVTVAIGHTESDAAQTARGIAHGATVATHLFNAMPSIHHRTPGPVPLLLDDPNVLVELIADGVHVHPDVLAMAIRAAGPSRVALITDAIVAAGMPDGEFQLGTLHVQVVDAVARLITETGPGSIAGSTLTMAAALRYAVQVVGVDLADAALMAATTPAAWHGLAEVGALATGSRADLVVVDDDLLPTRVMRAGQWLGADIPPPTETQEA